jgi:hypothetical protein
MASRNFGFHSLSSSVRFASKDDSVAFRIERLNVVVKPQDLHRRPVVPGYQKAEVSGFSGVEIGIDCERRPVFRLVDNGVRDRQSGRVHHAGPKKNGSERKRPHYRHYRLGVSLGVEFPRGSSATGGGAPKSSGKSIHAYFCSVSSVTLRR